MTANTSQMRFSLLSFISFEHKQCNYAYAPPPPPPPMQTMHHLHKFIQAVFSRIIISLSLLIMIAISLHIREKDRDFAGFASAITRYQNAEYVQFYRRDSRSVDKAQPRLNITQTCPSNILQYFTTLKHGYFQVEKCDIFLILLKTQIVGTLQRF